MIRIKSHFNNFESFAQTIQGWGLDFKQLDCGSFEAKLHQFGNQDFLVTNVAINRNVLQSLTYPEGMYTFGLTVSKTRPTIRHKELKRNSLAIFPRGEKIDAVSHTDFHCYTFMIANHIVEKHLEGLPFHIKLLLHRGGVIDSNLDKVQELRESLTELNDKVMECADFLESELFQITTPEIILNHVFNILAAAEKQILPLPHLKRIKKLQTIEGWLARSIHETPSVAEICNRFQVNERTLRRMFKEYYGVSPQQYLLAIRLHDARKRIYQASGSNVRISDIANRFGFWHMGKFAMVYRRQFGELPSKTMMSTPPKGSAGQ